MIPFTFSRNTITLFLYGIPQVIDSTHPKFDEILEFLKTSPSTEEELRHLEALVNTAKAVKDSLKDTVVVGDVTVGLDAILYKGVPINSYLTEMILSITKQGLPATAWIRFMDNLYKNPSKIAVDELYLWLDKAGMPVTDDGCFLAYKKVKDDFSSYHKAPGGTIVMNLPGTIVEMPRNQVDDVRDRTCSTGLHFCSWHYLPSYYGDQGRVVVLKINPADVVSIPSDYDNAKGRAYRYAVLGVIDQAATQFAFAGRTIVDTDGIDFDDEDWFGLD